MEPKFWIEAWNEGRTAFHQENCHEKLTEYFPLLHPKKGQKVLVPLCGKSKDLLWLHGLELNVHGVELHDDAVGSFFSENGLSIDKKTTDQDFNHYRHGNLVLSCGDFFALKETNAYDYIYDRAALVALPFEMRKKYAQVIRQSLKPKGKYLLIVYEYDQAKLEGPPFSVDANEIHRLYEEKFTVKLMESQRPMTEGPRLSAFENLEQKVYVLEKIS